MQSTTGRKSMNKPKVRSAGEEMFALHCHANGIKVEREYRFCPDRRWRFDFAVPEKFIGIEIEGGTWASGRHNRGAGYEKDLEKYNTAVRLGYRVLRYTTSMVMAGTAINELLEICGMQSKEGI
jgi:very-short-patch-repair endonuclease